MTEIIRLSEGQNISGEALRQVAAGARACRIIAFPTDTVYGLGSTGLVKAAARRLYQIKSRDAAKPLPILVKSAAEAKRWAQWSPAAELLARKFWPGGLTLVLKPTQEGRLLTFAEYPTIAIRVPAHPVILKLLETSDVPWASTSANLAGSPPCTTGAAVVEKFHGAVDFIIDAGSSGGLESTVVDASEIPIRVLREGAVKAEQVLEALKQTA